MRLSARFSGLGTGSENENIHSQLSCAMRQLTARSRLRLCAMTHARPA